MRTSTPTVSLVSSLVAAALALAPVHGALAAAPKGDKADKASAEDEAPKDEATEDEAPEDEATEDEAAEGETPEDEAAEGETPEGETPEDEMTPEEAEAAAAAEAEAEAEAAAAAEAEAAAAAEAEAAAAAEAEKEKEAEPPPPSFMPDEDDGPEEPRIAGKSATGKGLMIAGGVVAGVGLGLTITFSLITRNCSIEGPLQCGLQNQDTFLIPMGAATLLAGTMVLGVGVGYHIRYKRWKRLSENKTALLPTTLPRGAGLAWVGRF